MSIIGWLDAVYRILFTGLSTKAPSAIARIALVWTYLLKDIPESLRYFHLKQFPHNHH